jgi:MoaA/NifB/PqqE/SkfB family radical SAM enzyme
MITDRMEKPTPTFSCIFVERYCPRACSYCRSKDVRGKHTRLTGEQWVDAIHKLDDFGIKFHLILGNEILLLGEGAITLVEGLRGREDYAMYSTFVEPWYTRYRERLVKAGLYNISCGVDYPWWMSNNDPKDDIWKKSIAGLEGLKWFRDKGVPDIQATITVHRKNLFYVSSLLDLLTEENIWSAINIIEYSKDEGKKGSHDFYGPKESLGELAFQEEDIPALKEVGKKIADGIRSGRWMVQNAPEYVENMHTHGYNQSWHCTLPLILAVEEDGTLRGCGYRPGWRLRERTVWELGDTLEQKEYIKLQRADNNECEGCFWSYWQQAELYWLKKQSPLIVSKYQTHYSEYWKKVDAVTPTRV